MTSSRATCFLARIVSLYFCVTLCCFIISACGVTNGAEPINVGFLWHMHQPIYIPGESITQTDAAGHFSFSVTDVHNQRFGPYTSWPRDAVQAGLGLPHLGTQISFSGSLIENLNNLEANNVNGGMWNNWSGPYGQAQNWDTSLGNTRMDMVSFGYHHPLMPLLDVRDMRMQIKLHKHIAGETWSGEYSKGMFPAETAFSSRMIPALKAEGIEWTLVDNIHFDRATQNYPHTSATGLVPPNQADQINPDPTANGGAWVQLNNLWAPSQVSAPFSYRPHYTQYVDPNNGQVEKIVAVPAARYEGNEDGRGGFGALLYEQVMDQYRQYNTDPNNPMLVVLHHDGDNFGGGSESYYHGNFQNMVNWAQNNPNYDVTTIQDHLDRYPVNQNDVIHIEPGSWAGADNGDPEFKKWLGDPNSSGWSPDRNSWAVLTAAKNYVFTADDIAPATDLQSIIDGNGPATERAWHFLLQAEASDHWYWDGTEVWDNNVTRGSNLAIAQASQVLNGFSGQETTPPNVFLPQRDIYNPGGYEFGSQPEDNDFEIWTYAHDVSGLSAVTLKWRVDGDGQNPLSSVQNETYAGGTEVGTWNDAPMNSSDVVPPGNILPAAARVLRYGARIEGQEDVLLDYYVEAIDSLGNIAKSDIQHVYVGAGTTQDNLRVEISPEPAVAGQQVTISYDPSGGPLTGSSPVNAHYGFDHWSTTVSPDPAMIWNATDEIWELTVTALSSASQLDVVFNDGNGTWDNNNGQDWHFDVIGGVDNTPDFVMDGQVDNSAVNLADNGALNLFVGLDGEHLYVATNDAGEGNDHFIYLAEQPGELVDANWAKNGQVAEWDAFLADENDNDFAGWFDSNGADQATTGTNGGVLEGVISLVNEFGQMPTEIYVAVGAFETQDGGDLVFSLQLPGSNNGDFNLDDHEWLRIELHTLRTGDFNRDGGFTCIDVDALVAAIVAESTDLAFDLTGDGLVDGSDLLDWLSKAGAALLTSGDSLLAGDANLDGQVDGVDFLIWNTNKFSQDRGWCGADFDANGQVDGLDFLIWNTNKFTSASETESNLASSINAVPEPAGLFFSLMAFIGILTCRCR